MLIEVNGGCFTKEDIFMSDRNDNFRYDHMVERALRGVVKTALDEVVEYGLTDEHHFYITFHTKHKGVEIPDYLRERYPNEMTIVLQHQFYDLDVDDKHFSVMLSFNNVPERLSVPLDAVTIFADPSVNFALQFQPLSDLDEDIDSDDEEKEDKLDLGVNGSGETGQVISLDSFRNKKGNDD